MHSYATIATYAKLHGNIHFRRNAFSNVWPSLQYHSHPSLAAEIWSHGTNYYKVRVLLNVTPSINSTCSSYHPSQHDTLLASLLQLSESIRTQISLHYHITCIASANIHPQTLEQSHPQLDWRSVYQLPLTLCQLIYLFALQLITSELWDNPKVIKIRVKYPTTKT